MNLDDLSTTTTTRTTTSKKMLCILPGGFHPFHAGHKSIYDYLVGQFPSADVYVATSNDTKKRPFNYAQKKFLAVQAGIPSDRFVEVASPYKSMEITSKYDPSNTVLIFALGAKDAGRLSTTKKDGSPGYFQHLPANQTNLSAFNTHAYFIETPVLEFTIAGENCTSASAIRERYVASEPAMRAVIAKEMYPHSKQLTKVIALLDSVLDKKNITESPDFGYSNYHNRDQEIAKISWKIIPKSHGYANEIRCQIEGSLKGRVIASIGASNIKNKYYPESTTGSAMYIDYVKILDEWKSTGLGQILYNKIINYAKANNFEYLRSDYSLSDSARKAWKKLSARYPVIHKNDTSYDYYEIDLNKISKPILESTLPVSFHSELNPKLWKYDKLKHPVSSHLKAIANSFIDYLNITNLKITDITISGSNAAYTYTPSSDIDLHIVVEILPEDQSFMKNFFDAKKNLFNQAHNFTIYDQPVELYVQFNNEPHISAGLYSLLFNTWIDFPQRVSASINDTEVTDKVEYFVQAVNHAVSHNDYTEAERLANHIRNYRREQLELGGELGTGNLVFKTLRNLGTLTALNSFRSSYLDNQLSLT